MSAETVNIDEEIVRTTIRMPADLHEAVDAVARASGISFNAAVTDALVDFVSGDERRRRVDRFFEEGRERFGALIDKLSS